MKEKAETKMKHISSKTTITDFSSSNGFVAEIESGETALVDTQDCFGGQITTEDQTLSSLAWDTINPCTGPIKIKNAHIGNILKIDILNIEVGSTGVVIKDAGDLKRFSISEAEKSIILKIKNNSIEYMGKSYAIKPMIGVIGVVTDNKQLTTLPGFNGGNMDNTAISIGSSIYLPVLKEGAGLVIGDLHAAMGDGETTGCGIETSGTVKIRVSVLSEKTMPLPFVETNDKYITVATDTSLDKAVDSAVVNMKTFLVENKHFDNDKAWVVMTIGANAKVCQIANHLKTARCEIKRILVD